jgi:bacterioferritin
MGWEDGVFAEREPPFPRLEMDRMVAEGAKRMGLHIRAAAKGSENLVRMLNEAIARELAGNTECIWHHLQAMEAIGGAAADLFRNVAIREMKHAEAIAERLCSIGGVPTAIPRPVLEGTTLNECLHLGARSKEETIRFYRDVIEEAEKEGDAATAFILKEIVEEEEEHRDLFTMMIEDGSCSCDSGSRVKTSDIRLKPASDLRSPKGNLVRVSEA